jgi:hypothetical protein
MKKSYFENLKIERNNRVFEEAEIRAEGARIAKRDRARNLLSHELKILADNFGAYEEMDKCEGSVHNWCSNDAYILILDRNDNTKNFGRLFIIDVDEVDVSRVDESIRDLVVDIVQREGYEISNKINPIALAKSITDDKIDTNVWAPEDKN